VIDFRKWSSLEKALHSIKTMVIMLFAMYFNIVCLLFVLILCWVKTIILVRSNNKKGIIYIMLGIIFMVVIK